MSERADTAAPRPRRDEPAQAAAGGAWTEERSDEGRRRLQGAARRASRVAPAAGRPASRLRRRPVDALFVLFFVVNAGFITYIVDLEQLVIADPHRFDQPLWPPAPLVDLVHWYGTNYDPLLMARPAFWRMTIWIDVLFFGPFYLFAIYAFVRGRNWIRVPALVWSGTMAANVLIILMEERYGEWATPHFPIVLLLNLPWLLMPVAMIWRMRRPAPFAAVATEAPVPVPVHPTLAQA